MAVVLKAGGNSGLAGRLLPKGQWYAFAFVDTCETVANGSPGDGQELLLREIQRIEFEVFLDHLSQPPVG